MNWVQIALRQAALCIFGKLTGVRACSRDGVMLVKAAAWRSSWTLLTKASQSPLTSMQRSCSTAYFPMINGAQAIGTSASQPPVDNGGTVFVRAIISRAA